MKWMKTIGVWLLDLIYPRRAVCMGCGSMLGCDRNDLCETCREKMAKSWIGVRSPHKKLQLDGTAFAYSYHGPAGGMVRNLKYMGVWILAEEMGRDLARAVNLLRLGENTLVTAVPMHPRRERIRGKNHAQVLAVHTASALGLEYVPLLMRTRNAPQQARLSHERRQKNLQDAFRVRPEFHAGIIGADVLLIDDVLTTGATAENCARALRAAGVRKVYFAAYANGERK